MGVHAVSTQCACGMCACTLRPLRPLRPLLALTKPAWAQACVGRLDRQIDSASLCLPVTTLANERVHGACYTVRKERARLSTLPV